MPTRHGFKLAHLLTGFALIALLAGSSVALAAAGKSGEVTINPGKVGSVTARCPARTGLIAAGFATPHFNPSNNESAAVRIGSKRVGTKRLETTGFNFGGKPGKINSYAYCSRAGRTVRVASQKAFVPTASPGFAVATCPGSSKVVSGGFASPGFSANGPRVITVTSKRVRNNQWRVEAYNINDDGSTDPHPGTLIAYAYCLDDAPKIVTRHRRANAGLKGKATKLTVKCPRRMRAISGGFDGNIYLSKNSTGSGAIVSRRANNGHAWRTSAVSISEQKAKATAYAYCVPHRHSHHD